MPLSTCCQHWPFLGGWFHTNRHILLRIYSSWKGKGWGSEIFVREMTANDLRNNKLTLLVPGPWLPVVKGWHCYHLAVISHSVLQWDHLSQARSTPKVFISFCNSVLLGWDSRVWFALCLHLCLLQESTSSQNLAAIREEGSLGCVLQSCCDWNQAACCCGNRLCCNGLLRPVYKMNPKASISPTANQGDEGEEPVGAWAQRRRAQLKSSKSPGWHHSICPYDMWGKFLMVTNIMLQGTPKSQLPLTCV